MKQHHYHNKERKKEKNQQTLPNAILSRKEQRSTIISGKAKLYIVHVNINESSRSRMILEFYRIVHKFYLVFMPCNLFTAFFFRRRKNRGCISGIKLRFDKIHVSAIERFS